nr:type III toxin-antitoxin system ToxN/AbiQ family toxin [uncultured Dubosiella sp.]
MKKNNRISFYDVNIDYINYLKQFDPKVPNIVYDSHQKFLCGVVFKINGMKYYVPVSSFNKEMQSNYVIQIGGIPVGSLRFSFMFPVPDSEIELKRIWREQDHDYRFLMNKELNFCVEHSEAIQAKARSVYFNVQKNRPKIGHFFCDFKKLERKCKEWIYHETIKKLNDGLSIKALSFQEKMTLAQGTTDQEYLELLSKDEEEAVRRSAEKQKHKRIDINKFGKIMKDMYEIAKKSDNYTWFLESSEFEDGTYTMKDYEDLIRDVELLNDQYGILDIDTIIEIGDYEQGMSGCDTVATFYGEFYSLFADNPEQARQELMAREAELDYEMG